METTRREEEPVALVLITFQVDLYGWQGVLDLFFFFSFSLFPSLFLSFAFFLRAISMCVV